MKAKITKAITKLKKHYPELKHTEFKIKERHTKHPIKIIPTIFSYFRKKHKRKYKIIISKKKKEKLKKLSQTEIENWIKDELVFTLESQGLTSIKLIGYTLQYIFNKNSTTTNLKS
jgi:hypothetical protein